MATGLVFTTVGTTNFDYLIKKIVSPSILNILKLKGYTKLLLQIGNGEFIPITGEHNGITIEYYRFKKSILDDILAADLVISHAGAGSIMETLYAQKPLLVVINETLMSNHQTEIAEKLGELNHLFYTNCAKLEKSLLECDYSKLVPFENNLNNKFKKFLNEINGFTNHSN